MANNRLLDELIESRSRLTEAEIKYRADHIIHAAINLIEEIEDKYGEEAKQLLEKRLLASIKNRNPKKFRFTKR